MIISKIAIDSNNEIVIIKNIHGIFGALRFGKLDHGKWHYQHLQLSCRGGAKGYFPFAKKAYRHAKEGILKGDQFNTFKRLFV